MYRIRKPQWWLLFLLVPLLAGLFYVESRFYLSAPVRRFVQVAVVLLIFGLVYRWLSAQSAVLLRPPEDAPYKDASPRNRSASPPRHNDQNGQASNRRN